MNELIDKFLFELFDGLRDKTTVLLKEESKKREEYYILKRGILLTQILLLGFLILIAIYKFWF